MTLYKIIQMKKKICRYLYYLVYKKVLRKCGIDVFFDENVAIHNPQNIVIENHCNIKRGVVLNSRVEGNACGISLSENVKIHEYSYLDDYGGKIEIGENSGIGQFCVIGGQGGLKIGCNCMIGGHTYIIPANHRISSLDIPFREQGENKKGIVIGNNVWIGSGCIILDGVTIGDNSVIGAGTVVTKDIVSGTLNVGVPSRILRTL